MLAAVRCVSRRCIATGDRVPESLPLKLLRGGAAIDTDTKSVFMMKKVVLFGLPGAFTSVCSNKQLPSFVNRAPDLKAKGVDEVICLTVNDKDVCAAWAEQTKAGSVVSFIADGSAELTKALKADVDLSKYFMGVRSHRFAAVVENGIVKAVHVEDSPGKFEVSGAENLLKHL